MLKLTWLDLALVLFTASAGLSAWAAPDAQAAAVKLAVLLAAVLLGLVFARLPQIAGAGRWFRPAAWLLAAAGAGVSLYYLLTQDWTRMPVDLALINRLGQGWMAARRLLGLEALLAGLPGGLNPNLVGGLAAAYLPLGLALARPAGRSRLPAGALLVVMLAGLVMSSSRAAWAALAAGLAVWALAAWSSRRGGRSEAGLYRLAFGGFFLLAGLGVWLALVLPPQIVGGLAERLPGDATAGSRARLFVDAFYLAQDYWLTGGGLAAFGGLHSTYLLVIPFRYFDYAHNLYLDLAVEQGVGGLLLYLWIFAGSVAGLARASDDPNLAVQISPAGRRALLAGLIVTALHGLLDDPFYGHFGTPLLFALPGLAAAVASTRTDTAASPNRSAGRRALPLRLAVILFAAFICLAPLAASGRFQGGALAGLGAVSLARLDLQGFPSGKWQPALNPAEDSPAGRQRAEARQLFQAALAQDGDNVTALHRLGWMEMQAHRFEAACPYLEQALAGAPGHRGLRKSLGYCYAWTGRPDDSARLLNLIPEAYSEMETYVWWWGEQGRPDLADRAAAMLAYFRP